jgi:uncharacterized RDD family membrane protein YckC
VVAQTKAGGQSVSGSALRIRTPEGITFAYELAGPVTRCLAWAIDGVVLISAFLGLSIGLGGLGFLNPDLIQAISIASWFVLSFGYSIAFEWLWRGQTIGKKVLRLRVMDADGLRLQFHQVVMRNLVRVADALPLFYLVGGIACLFSRKSQRLGDLAAGTIVVHHRKHLEPDLEQLLGNKFNSLRSHVHLCARLRQRVSPTEARLALQALVRRDEFAAADRIRLFAELATHFKALVHFPPELLEAMPDEQFIRNVVDVLFRTSEPKVRTSAPQADLARA